MAVDPYLQGVAAFTVWSLVFLFFGGAQGPYLKGLAIWDTVPTPFIIARVAKLVFGAPCVSLV